MSESSLSPLKIVGIGSAFVACMGGVVGYVWAENHFGALIKAELDRSGQPYNLQYAEYSFSLWNQSVQLGRASLAIDQTIFEAATVRSVGLQWESEPQWQLTGVRSITAEQLVGFTNAIAERPRVEMAQLTVRSPQMTPQLAALSSRASQEQWVEAMMGAVSGFAARQISVSASLPAGSPQAERLKIDAVEFSKTGTPGESASASQRMVATNLHPQGQPPEVQQTVDQMLPNQLSLDNDWTSDGDVTARLQLQLNDVHVDAGAGLANFPVDRMLQARSQRDREALFNGAALNEIKLNLKLGDSALSQTLRSQMTQAALTLSVVSAQVPDQKLKTAAQDLVKVLAGMRKGEIDQAEVTLRQTGKLTFGQLRTLPPNQISQNFDIQVVDTF